MMITVEQIKAARALLRWTQKDLANHAGLDVDQVARIEAERTKSLEVVEGIHKALTFQGIRFSQYGVELKPDTINVIEGEEWYIRLLDDVYLTLIDQANAELLLFCADDKVSPPQVNARYRKMRNADIRMRQLVEDGNPYLMGPLKEYRYVPKQNFKNYVSLVYGDKVAICTENNTKAIVFKDAHLAETWRNIFDLLWNLLPQPEKSVASERF